MVENDTKLLSAQQRRAVEALLTHGTVKAAAEAAGVTRKTMYRWQGTPEFIAAVKEAEAAAIEELSRALTGLGREALQALRDALAPTQRMNHRLRAAEIALGNLLRVRELVEIEERLARLEAMSNG